MAKAQPWEIATYITEEIEVVVPDCGNYLVLTVSSHTPPQLFYTIKNSCPVEKRQKIEKVILENVALLNLEVIDSLE